MVGAGFFDKNFAVVFIDGCIKRLEAFGAYAFSVFNIFHESLPFLKGLRCKLTFEVLKSKVMIIRFPNLS